MDISEGMKEFWEVLLSWQEVLWSSSLMGAAKRSGVWGVKGWWWSLPFFLLPDCFGKRVGFECCRWFWLHARWFLRVSFRENLAWPAALSKIMTGNVRSHIHVCIENISWSAGLYNDQHINFQVASWNHLFFTVHKLLDICSRQSSLLNKAIIVVRLSTFVICRERTFL